MYLAANDTRRIDGYRAAAYYTNWATYARDYQPSELPLHKLTHVFYAFANVHPDNGEFFLFDEFADIEKRFPADRSTESATDLFGCIKQLFLLKKRNRNLKTLLSIGGSSFSANFTQAVSTSEGRQHFADSAVKLLGDLGFDGLDIDWEYPKNDTDAQNYVSLLSLTREALDRYSLTLPQTPHFLLTVASSCGSDHFELLKLGDMDRHVDFWNLMAYDFTGSWTTETGHQANLYLSEQSPTSTPFNTEAAVEYYVTTAGIAANKINLGMPLYGRTFGNTAGPGSPYKGVGNTFDWEPGTWDYKSLPRPGAVESFDEKTVASWSYDSIDRTMVTYDNEHSVAAKAKYIKERQLGGAMWWESSGDRTDEKSLIQMVTDSLNNTDGNGMDKTQNVLNYPSSQYDNLRNGFPGE
ncbi:glycoside hydrolase [Aureobasidium pullulans]|uniref:chitinase n=1 Tax=Aureobasidium pullulans TaxID=5580 RepID=A0A4S9VNJ2_AURPU|nr:glycoside hydrolase [Aureobasidium pullulans]THZ53216.1 glycoside hydrolase [Aureobasidium pullulans]